MTVRVPFSPVGLLVVIVASGVALWAGPDLTVAVPASIVAVAGGVGLLALAIRTSRPPLRAPPPALPVASHDHLRSLFHPGRIGREAMVFALDRLERLGPHPTLPARRTEELERLRSLSLAEFRAYVRARLDALEAGT